MSTSRKEDSSKKSASKGSNNSGKNNKKIEDVDDLDPESYLEAMCYSLYTPTRFGPLNSDNKYQIEKLPGLRRPQENHEFNFSQVYCPDKYEESKLEDYLDFAHKFMKEQSINASGP